jgi:Ni,Fe-hydrogenase III large subunit/Ni,Fe-hydrogenase III component G
MRLQPPTVRHVDRDDLPQALATALIDGGRLALVAGHDDGAEIRIVYVILGQASDRTELVVAVPRDDRWIPTAAGVSYPAGRFERELRDLFGVVPRDHPMPFRLVRHTHWPTGHYPMLSDADPSPTFDGEVAFPFPEVNGQGVYEIPVGPVHAGLIEPGHFRFQVMGETILKLYQRLWFMHRGVEKRFQGMSIVDGVALSERISGDTSVGHSLAYVMAVEDALGIEVGRQARQIRAVLLECERLYNHIGDIGAIVNDVGFGIVHQHASRLRETLLRHNRRLTGHRLLRGALTIGGVRLADSPDVDLLRSVAAEVAEVVAIAAEHPMVANRLATTAILPMDAAERLGVWGCVARASGIGFDARIAQPFVDPGESFRVVTREAGDVRARFEMRAEEVQVSVDVIADLAERLGTGTSTVSAPPPDRRDGSAGLGVVEAWRGTLVHRVEVGPGGILRRVKVVDPSFSTWPGLPVALADTIVPDFPLANKSFNMSYAGNDL